MEGKEELERKYNRWVIIIGVVLAIAVGVIYVTPKVDMQGTWMDFLPMVNATINGTVSLLLIAGLAMIKQKRIELHRLCMTSSIVLSAIFLVSYVLYHTTHPSTSFGGEGFIRNVYFFILITHILLAIVIAPLVLITYFKALSERFDKHKKLARITYPMWLYVSITGVLVYIMISPYY